MGRLGDSFSRVSDDYDRGRPRYPAAAVAAMLAGLPEAPEVLDIGAGTGQLSLALAEAGARVIAVEPGAEQRAVLSARLPDGAVVLDARAEELPLGNEEVDLVVCADSFHWLDAPRALAEFRRVLRPGGRLVVSTLMLAWEAKEWAHEAGTIVRPLWERAEHPLLRSGFALPEVPAGSGFEPAGEEEIPFVHETDRDGLLALFGSWSAVAALPDEERTEVLSRLAEVLDRHGVGEIELGYNARIRLHRSV